MQVDGDIEVDLLSQCVDGLGATEVDDFEFSDRPAIVRKNLVQGVLLSVRWARVERARFRRSARDE
jgi:hypothetical protein